VTNTPQIDLSSDFIRNQLLKAPVYEQNAYLIGREATPGEVFNRKMDCNDISQLFTAQVGDYACYSGDPNTLFLVTADFFAKHCVEVRPGQYEYRAYFRIISNPNEPNLDSFNEPATSRTDKIAVKCEKNGQILDSNLITMPLLVFEKSCTPV
jgi:hypothetical protein